MSKRILVVEDDGDSRRILRDLLASADYQMLEAEDGKQGIAVAEAQRPDLILMDIRLPLVDGYEATRRIKANPELRSSLCAACCDLMSYYGCSHNASSR